MIYSAKSYSYLIKKRNPEECVFGIFKHGLRLILSLLYCNSNLEDGVYELERGEDDIVYILDVVEVEELLKIGELLAGYTVLVLENLVRLILRLLLGLESHNGEYYGVDIEQKSDNTEHDGAYTVTVEHEEIDNRAYQNQGNEGKRTEGDEGDEADTLLHIGIAFLIEDSERRFLCSHTERGD